MPRVILCLWILVLSLLALPLGLQAAPAGDSGRFEAAGLSDQEVRTFLDALQKGVRSSNADQVAALVEFPLDVHQCNRTLHIQRKEFNQRFASVFDRKISKAIADATFETLFSNWQGVMIGDGEVWFTGICEGSTQADPCSKQRVRVITVNKDCP
jgi:hypothetical protein